MKQHLSFAEWAYEKKGVVEEQATIIVCEGNFHGRTISIVSFSVDPDAYGGYGPYTPGFKVIPYNDVEALKQALLENPNIAGFLGAYSRRSRSLRTR